MVWGAGKFWGYLEGRKFLPGFIAVSYTHLDVYKRQHIRIEVKIYI